MRFGGSAPSRMVPKYLRSDMGETRVGAGYCSVSRARQPAGAHEGKKNDVIIWAMTSAAKKPQRHSDAEDSGNPLRRGVSAAKKGCWRRRVCSKTKRAGRNPPFKVDVETA